MTSVKNIVQDYATRLRQGVPEDCVIKEFRERYKHRFQELCLVHLSFLIDVPWSTFEQLSTPPQEFPYKSALKRLLSGTKFTPQHLRTDLIPTHLANNVISLIDRLDLDEACSMEGIFRKSGHMLRKRQLHDALFQQSFNPHCFLWDVYNPHDLASALKSVLVKLPCPLLTDRLIPLFLQVAHLRRTDIKMDASESTVLPQPTNRPMDADSVVNGVLVESKQIKALRILFQLLPQSNKRILKRLLQLLLRVIRLESENRMNSVCLGTVFGPVLFPHDVIENLNSNSKCSKFLPTEYQDRYKRVASITTSLLDVGMDIFLVPLSLAEDIHTNSVELAHTTVGMDTLNCSKRMPPLSPISQICARYVTSPSRFSRRCGAAGSPSVYSPHSSSAMEESPPLRMGIRFATPTVVNSVVVRGPNTNSPVLPASPFVVPTKLLPDSRQLSCHPPEAEQMWTDKSPSHVRPSRLPLTTVVVGSRAFDDRIELRSPLPCSSLVSDVEKPGLITVTRRSSLSILPLRCGDPIVGSRESPMKPASSISHLDGASKYESGKKRRYTEMKLPSCMQRSGQRRNLFSPCPSLRFLQFRRAFPDRRVSPHILPQLDASFLEHHAIASAVTW